MPNECNYRRSMIVVMCFFTACTKRTNVCTKDSDCKDPAYPFCDVNGEYLPSGGEKNVCTIVPDSCPISRCGCTPGAVISCSGSDLTSCAADGMSTDTTACPLGCASDGTRCSSFTASNGLSDALAQSATLPDVVLPAGAKIDTESGVVVDGGGTPIPITSMVVDQPSGLPIRVFVGHVIVLNDATVVGANPLGLAGSAGVTLQGFLDIAAHGTVSAPGGVSPPFGSAPSATGQPVCAIGTNVVTTTYGGAGAGNAVAGGNTRGHVGGTAAAGFSPLYGGGRGGDMQNSSGTVIATGGGGGGAVEIVSATQVLLTNAGFISLGGGGGSDTAGGGAGGTAIIEAPLVQLNGNLTGVTANGGAGGGCGSKGRDATTTTAPAAAMSCPGTKFDYSPGAGGTALVGPGSSGACINAPCLTCDAGSFGGGGGAAGRLRVATRDGTFATTGTPTMSVVVSTATLMPQ